MVLAPFVQHWICNMASSDDNKSRSSNTGQADPAAGISDQLYTSYNEQRRYLIDSEAEAAKSYDKWLLTLSGGALALSMTFAKDIAFPNGADGLGWLLVAWLALVGALALGLVSIYLSQRAHENFRECLDDTLEEFVANSENAGFWHEVRKKQERCWYARWVGYLNLFSGAAFVVGIVLLSVFACVNVPEWSDKKMTKKPNESTEKVVPAEPPAPSPTERPTPGSDRPGKGKAGAKPPTVPVDQAPPPKPEKPAEKVAPPKPEKPAEDGK